MKRNSGQIKGHGAWGFCMEDLMNTNSAESLNLICLSPNVEWLFLENFPSEDPAWFWRQASFHGITQPFGYTDFDRLDTPLSSILWNSVIINENVIDISPFLCNIRVSKHKIDTLHTRSFNRIHLPLRLRDPGRFSRILNYTN